MQHLPDNIRSDVRFFAFLVGNGTAFIDDSLPDYRTKLIAKPELLVTLFRLFLQDSSSSNKELRVKNWLRSLVDSTYSLEPPLVAEELETKDFADWKLAVVEFTVLITKSGHSLEPVLEYGSDLELVYMVLMNNLKVDSTDKLVNKSHAHLRGLEIFKEMVLPDYKADPPMEDWETALIL